MLAVDNDIDKMIACCQDAFSKEGLVKTPIAHKSTGLWPLQGETAHAQDSAIVFSDMNAKRPFIACEMIYPVALKTQFNIQSLLVVVAHRGGNKIIIGCVQHADGKRFVAFGLDLQHRIEGDIQKNSCQPVGLVKLKFIFKLGGDFVGGFSKHLGGFGSPGAAQK